MVRHSALLSDPISEHSAAPVHLQESARENNASKTIGTAHSTQNTSHYVCTHPMQHTNAVFYRARDRKTQECVAIKVFPANQLRKSKFRRRFRQEIRMLIKCRGHCNLMKLYRVHKWSGNVRSNEIRASTACIHTFCRLSSSLSSL